MSRAEVDSTFKRSYEVFSSRIALSAEAYDLQFVCSLLPFDLMMGTEQKVRKMTSLGPRKKISNGA